MQVRKQQLELYMALSNSGIIRMMAVEEERDLGSKNKTANDCPRL